MKTPHFQTTQFEHLALRALGAAAVLPQEHCIVFTTWQVEGAG